MSRIHDYTGVERDEVWSVVSSRTPELQETLEQLAATRDGSRFVKD